MQKLKRKVSGSRAVKDRNRLFCDWFKLESQGSDQSRKSTIVRKVRKTRSSYVPGAAGTGMVRENVSIIEHVEISGQKK